MSELVNFPGQTSASDDRMELPGIPDSFAGYPQSVSERRSDMTHSGTDWTPRDALICTLREIDEGKIDPQFLFICHGSNDTDGSSSVDYRCAGGNPILVNGLISRAHHSYNEDCRSK